MTNPTTLEKRAELTNGNILQNHVLTLLDAVLFQSLAINLQFFKANVEPQNPFRKITLRLFLFGCFVGVS